MDDTARSIGDDSDVDPDVQRRTGEIRRDIEQTRGEMSETIEAIEEKLRPGNIVSSATERVKNAATEKVSNMKQSAEQAFGRMRSGATNSGGFMAGIRENPIPAAMIGIGAAWLLIRSRSNANGDSRSQWSNYADDNREGDYTRTTGMSGTGRQLASRAEEYTREITTDARDRGRRVQNHLQRMASENPLMVGAGALLLGSLVGLAFPETEQENEWLGETRDSMLDKAQEIARNTATRVQETATDLANEATSRMVGGTPE